MTVRICLDAEEFERLEESIRAYGDGADRVISAVLHGSGEEFHRDINSLIHPSGRRFKGHAASATASAWPRFETNVPLQITVGTKQKFHYLYFPDDGSRTDRHRGLQRFFKRGAEAAAPDVMEQCLSALLDEWKERP